MGSSSLDVDTLGDSTSNDSTSNDGTSNDTGLDTETVRRIGLQAGLAAVGVAPAGPLEPARSVLSRRRDAGLAATMQFTYRNPQRSTDPQQVLHGAASLVVGLLDYRRRDRSRPPGTTARIARYASEDFYGQLRAGLGAIATHLEGAGRRARVVADSNALVDRNAAWLAGLGWYGKNTNLLVEGVGSWFVMGAVVTDAQLEPTAEPAADGCGTCTACLAGCPTGALVAPGVLDARRCIAWLVQSAEPIPAEHRAAVGDRIYGCDICQEVCPPNRVALGRRPPPPAGQDAEPWADVVWILQAADDELLERYGRWYIANRDPDVIRRTALVVLGNIGDGTDPTVVALIERYVSHPVPLLRAHAVWAARRLGLDELSAAAAADPDPAVRAELSAPTAAR